MPTVMLRLSEGVSVVVPVYNGAEILPSLVSRLEPVLYALGAPGELILVNDASGDGSWELIRDMAGGKRWLRGIDLAANRGQQGALLCGIAAARFGVTVTMDDDLQHPPEEIPKLLARLGEGFDVVYGVPDAPHRGPWRSAAGAGGGWVILK
ncbi:MAG: glycosyltransferase, partial [bacterium]